MLRQLLSIEEAGDQLGVDLRFMRRIVAERRIRHYKVGKYVRFDIADLDAYLDANCREAVR